MFSLKKTGWALAAATGLCACAAPAPLITTSLQVIDSRFDARPDSSTAAIVARYKPLLDARMDVVIGRLAQALPAGDYDSPLARFTTHAILRYAQQVGVAVDFSLYNTGGLRAGLPQGDVRLFDLFATYSFDNDVTILSIHGKYLRELAGFFARTQPQPMGNAELVVAHDGRTTLRINGEELDDDKIYRLITNNFVAEGGDRMTMLRHAVAVERPGVLFRDAMIRYLQTGGADGADGAPAGTTGRNGQ